MSNVIQFLESLGGRSAPSAAEYAAIVAGLSVNEAQQQALLNRDQEALNGLLGGREEMMCLVWQPGEEPVRKKDDQDDQQPSEDKPLDSE